MNAAEKIECGEFLEYIRYSICLEPFSIDWDLETDLQKHCITLKIKSSKKFVKDQIEFVVNTIADYELFKFDSLRKLGWCSSTKIIECLPGYLEFSWLNLRKSDDSPIKKCSCMVCDDRFSEQDN